MGRSRLCLALIVVLLAAGSAARAACQLQRYVELPVTVERGGAVVKAKLNGADTRLTVDTGAFFSMLNPSAVTKFGLRTGPLPSSLTVGGMTGAADVRLTTVRDFEVLGPVMHHVDFLVGEHDMGGADGLLGQNLLAVLDTEFDFANGAIRLLQPVGCGDAPLAYWDTDAHAYGEMAIDPIGPPDSKIVGSVTINGVKLRAVFDTGAHRSVLSLRGARRAGVKTTDPGVTPGGVWGGIGRGLMQTWIAPFSVVDIGGEQIKNTRLRVADIELPDSDMVIGADFFLSHRIYVSKSQRKLYFTYNGGPVFNLDVESSTPSIAAAADAPTDAAGFARRGDADMAREQYVEAIADYGRAADLDPKEPQHVYDRARARLAARQPLLALADLDQALTLRPDDARALVLRGEVRALMKNQAGASSDFEAALSHDPSLRLRVAESYAAAGDLDDALANYDLWIAGQPKGENLAGPLNGRCWVRALAGRDLDKALADCNEALRLRPGLPQALDSRGLVFLRLNQPDKAIADYSAALKVAPRVAWSLYGRGLAEQRKGLQPQGDADIAAAIAIRPHIGDEAKAHGIVP